MRLLDKQKPEPHPQVELRSRNLKFKFRPASRTSLCSAEASGAGMA